MFREDYKLNIFVIYPYKGGDKKVEYEYSANYYVGVGVSNCACVESDGCAHDRVLVCTQCVRVPLFYSRP